MAMTLDGTNGLTFPNATVQTTASILTKYLVTDSTDIVMSAVFGTSQQNVGSSFTMNIPANGYISLRSIAGRFLNSATASAHNYYFGIRIGTTNYWFNQYSVAGVPLFNTSAVQIQTPTVASTAYDIFGISSNLTNGSICSGVATLDVSLLSIPTGNQTVQLITAYSTTAGGTLKGTTFQTRIFLETVG